MAATSLIKHDEQIARSSKTYITCFSTQEVHNVLLLEIAFIEYRMHYVRCRSPRQVNTSSKSATFPQFLAIQILKWRIQPAHSLFPSSSVLFFSLSLSLSLSIFFPLFLLSKPPEQSWRIKYHRGVARGKRRDFRRLISVPRSVVRANRANRFQVRRGILYPRISSSCSSHRSLSLSLSLSLSVWLAPMYPFVLHSLVQAIPEFVITESREPRNRNFAGYDIRPRSKERPDEKERFTSPLPSPLFDGRRKMA